MNVGDVVGSFFSRVGGSGRRGVLVIGDGIGGLVSGRRFSRVGRYRRTGGRQGDIGWGGYRPFAISELNAARGGGPIVVGDKVNRIVKGGNVVGSVVGGGRKFSRVGNSGRR